MERGPSARPVDPIGAKAAGAKKPPVVGRFAPTPSGRMHLGNVFSCLMAWLSAKSGGGRVVLRIEDLDPRAQDPAVADRLMADLDWLGLGWDEGPYFQSDRTELYEEAVGRLGALGLTYPCFCTRAELHAATAPHASDGTYLYAGTCRGLTAEQIAQKSLRRAPATRLRVPEAGDPAGAIEFCDLAFGPQKENEFFHHRDWSGVSVPEFCRMLDAYLRYYNEGRPKERLGWMSPMQYRRSLGLAA